MNEDFLAVQLFLEKSGFNEQKLTEIQKKYWAFCRKELDDKLKKFNKYHNFKMVFYPLFIPTVICLFCVSPFLFIDIFLGISLILSIIALFVTTQETIQYKRISAKEWVEEFYEN